MFGLGKKKQEKKSVPSINLYEETTRGGLTKQFIPKFLYKPPFGYPRNADLVFIRQLAKSPYVEMCISTTIEEMASVKWQVVPEEGYVIEGEDAENAKGVVPQEQVDHVTNFLKNPNTNFESFEDIFIRKIARDVLEVESGILVKTFNLKKQMVEIIASDGASFTKNPNIHGMFTYRDDLIIPRVIVDNPDQIGSPFIHISAMDARKQAAYFQYGFFAAPQPIPFGKREIVWFEKSPRTSEIYGVSPVMILAQTIQMLIYSLESDLDYFDNNNVPKGFYFLEGANTEQIKSFKQQLKEQMYETDIFGSLKKKTHQTPIMNVKSGFEKIEFSSAELQVIEKQKWYSKLVWSCYDDKTEILTSKGWKLFKDLNNEEVARVNPRNLNIDFIKPLNKQIYDFDGEMYKYKHRNIDLLVTPDHKMLYKSEREYNDNKETDWNVCQAKDELTMYIPQAGNFEGKKIDKISFGGLEMSGNDFISFMGFWLGDGWVESSNNRIALCASEVYSENIAFCHSLLKRIGVDYKVNTTNPNVIIQGKKVKNNGNMHYFRFSNRAFADYLRQFGKCYNKFIPKIIKNCNKNQRKLFFESYLMTDGCESRKGQNARYFSMSKRLIDDLQEMYVKEGIATNINKWNNGYELTMRKSQFKDSQNTSLIKKSQIQKEYYKGKVYDITVPDLHFLVVRRNGRVSISGNCFGVTPTELGFTEDAKGLSNQIVQSKVFRKKAINPLLRLIERKINAQIIPEFEYEHIRFRFDMFDIEEEKSKTDLYEKQINNGLRTVNEIRREEARETVDWGDEPPKNWRASESSFNFGGGIAGFNNSNNPRGEDIDSEKQNDNAFNSDKKQTSKKDFNNLENIKLTEEEKSNVEVKSQMDDVMAAIETDIKLQSEALVEKMRNKG